MRTVQPHFPSTSVISCPRRKRASSGGQVARSPTYLRATPHARYACRTLRSQSDLSAARTRLCAGYPQYPGKRGRHQKEIARRETAARYGGIGNHSQSGSGTSVNDGRPISPHAVEAAKDNDYGASPMDCVPQRDGPRRVRSRHGRRAGRLHAATRS
jgi:hypothetical protein